MKKIMILVQKDCVLFSKYNRDISEENLNNTNVIDVKNLKFTEEYILENMELISTFLNLIFLKFNVNKVIIKNLEIAEIVLQVISKLSIIKEINFTEDKQLTYSISSLLLENKNLEKIICYSIPSMLFYKFEKNQIETRCEITSISNFVKVNKIKTLSDVFNKNSIIISDCLTKIDVYDLISFLEHNNNLKYIEFEKYDEKNLKAVLFYIRKNNLKNVTIIINEKKSNIDELLSGSKMFDKLNKEYKVNIKINYSKEYIKQNRLKELNLTMLRNIIIVIVVLVVVCVCLYKITEKRDTKKLKENIDKIEDQIEDKIEDKIETVFENEIPSNELVTEEQIKEVSSYYKNYSKVYSELLGLNNDTVGWLTVNNTQINYPVVQSKDNDYYLNHAYDNSNNLGGWIFVDYRNDMNLINKNTIIYGHNISNSDLMFSTLKNVLDSNWYSNENNLNINFSIKDTEYIWKIFSIYTIEVTSDYLYTEFNTDNDYLNFLQKLKDRSINNFNENLTIDDRILTLSTCYKDDKHRVVVHAKLIR